MKKITVIAAAALSMVVAAPAMAATDAPTFTGPRVEVTVGADDLLNIRDTNSLTYGGAIGLDAPVFGGDVVVGVEASADNFLDGVRDFSGSVRVGVPMGRVMPYAKAGYQDFRGLTGVRVGGGVEVALTNNIYTKVEYRYSDLTNNVGRHQGLVGIGVRF